MKKIFKLASCVLAATLVLTAFTGCKHNVEKEVTTEPIALSMALGVHQGFPQISTSNRTLDSTIEKACEGYGDVSAFAIGGKAAQIGDYPLQRTDKNISKTKEKQIVKQNVEAIKSDISNFKYGENIEPETNPLSAIDACANTLSTSKHSERILLVFDSGLTTTGVLKNSNVLDANPKLIVEKLKELHALPNLDNVKVIWIGLGATAGRQSEIPESYKFKLQELWTAIIEASGGTVVFDSANVSGDELPGLPWVSTVDFPVDAINLNPDDFKDKTIKLGEDDIKFAPNSSNFVDSVAAGKTLNPVAEFLNNDAENRIIIAGTTASARGDGIELSLQRAEAVKQILVENYGVNKDKIKTVGLGANDNCLHVVDIDKNGNLIESEAKKNRSIYIFGPESSTAKSLNL